MREMLTEKQIENLKLAAKGQARLLGVKHHVALDQAASLKGYRSWACLVAANVPKTDVPAARAAGEALQWKRQQGLGLAVGVHGFGQ